MICYGKFLFISVIASVTALLLIALFENLFKILSTIPKPAFLTSELSSFLEIDMYYSFLCNNYLLYQTPIYTVSNMCKRGESVLITSTSPALIRVNGMMSDVIPVLEEYTGVPLIVRIVLVSIPFIVPNK